MIGTEAASLAKLSQLVGSVSEVATSGTDWAEVITCVGSADCETLGSDGAAGGGDATVLG